jgi:hypothetical protein
MKVRASNEAGLEHHTISPKTIFEQGRKVGRSGLSKLSVFNTSNL